MEPIEDLHTKWGQDPGFALVEEVYRHHSLVEHAGNRRGDLFAGEYLRHLPQGAPHHLEILPHSSFLWCDCHRMTAPGQDSGSAQRFGACRCRKPQTGGSRVHPERDHKPQCLGSYNGIPQYLYHALAIHRVVCF